jgi:YesN/AraC family two-component response regulator
MDDYITKPVRHEDLINALQRCIPQHTHQPSQPSPTANDTDEAPHLPSSPAASAV